MPLEYRERKTYGSLAAEYLLSLIPIRTWITKYSLADARSDLIAGLTVGLMVVPQGLAYASIAGLDEAYGLYSAFMGSFVYIFLGTAKDITLGPTAIMSLMTASNSEQVDGKTLPSHAIFLTFMAGIIQLGMGLLRLGFIVDFIAYPVISGFTSAAAITIGWGQVKHLFGLHNVRRPFTQAVHDVFANLDQTIAADFCMGVFCMVVLILLKRLKDKYNHSKTAKGAVFWFIGTARNAIVVALAGLFAYAMLRTNATTSCPSTTPPLANITRWCITVVGDVDGGLPKIEPPALQKTLKEAPGLMDGAVVIALIGYLESIAIGKSFARENSYELDPSQELVAIGSGNIVGSFFRSYPITGSFSRTAVNAASGVRTPMGGLVTGAVVILSLVFLSSLFSYIPQAALASIIIVSVLPMVKYTVPYKIWKVSKIDLLPFLISFFGSLFLSIAMGVGIGVGVNVLYILYLSARPGSTLLERQMGRARFLANNKTFKAIHHGGRSLVIKTKHEDDASDAGDSEPEKGEDGMLLPTHDSNSNSNSNSTSNGHSINAHSRDGGAVLRRGYGAVESGSTTHGVKPSPTSVMTAALSPSSACEPFFSPCKYSHELVATSAPTFVYQVGGSLMFPAAADVAETLLTMQRSTPRCRAIVLDMHKVNYIDFTGALKVQDAMHELGRNGVRLAFANLNASVRERILRARGYAEGVSIHNSIEEAFLSVTAAVEEEVDLQKSPPLMSPRSTRKLGTCIFTSILNLSLTNVKSHMFCMLSRCGGSNPLPFCSPSSSPHLLSKQRRLAHMGAVRRTTSTAWKVMMTTMTTIVAVIMVVAVGLRKQRGRGCWPRATGTASSTTWVIDHGRLFPNWKSIYFHKQQALSHIRATRSLIEPRQCCG